MMDSADIHINIAWNVNSYILHIENWIFMLTRKVNYNPHRHIGTIRANHV